MTDIHIHSPVVHIHVDQSRMDAAAVARQIQSLMSKYERRRPDPDDEGDAGQPAVKP